MGCAGWCSCRRCRLAATRPRSRPLDDPVRERGYRRRRLVARDRRQNLRGLVERRAQPLLAAAVVVLLGAMRGFVGSFVASYAMARGWNEFWLALPGSASTRSGSPLRFATDYSPDGGRMYTFYGLFVLRLHQWVQGDQ